MSPVRKASSSRSADSGPPPALPGWTFLSNHSHVLLLIARDPEIKLREIAWRVGITERAVQRIVADLEASAYLERERIGRRNNYRIYSKLPLRHPIEANTTIGALLNLILDDETTAPSLRERASSGRKSTKKVLNSAPRSSGKALSGRPAATSRRRSE